MEEVDTFFKLKTEIHLSQENGKKSCGIDEFLKMDVKVPCI